MDQSLRLRLVVRRHGLPEARILFNVPLDNDPTIAQLVELVNESIPLESDDWGLDDYTVELHAKDGHAFECLHFQSVASILEKDDEIFVRPLLTNDLKKRRISGRDQISSGGLHLIDGVPFGRPRLRAPRGRPAVHIAPRKRRRLTYDGDFDQDEFDDDDQGEGVDGDPADKYYESRHDQGEEQEDAEPLLLTQHGEPQTRKDNRRVHFPRSVTATAEFDEADAHSESSENEEDTEAEDDQEEDMFEPDAEDLQEELRGLAEEAADNQPAEDRDERSRSRDIGAEERPSVPGEVNDFGPFTEEDSESESPMQSGLLSVDSRNRSSHDISDKVIAVRSAFPAVPGDVCERLLVKHNHDVGSVWKKLAQQLKPRLDLAQTMVLNTQLELPKEVMVISSPPRKLAEAPGEVSRIGDEDDATDSSSSAEEDEEEEDDESEAHTTSSESEDDESSDSEGDAANGADSSDSSSDSSDQESENGDHDVNLGGKVKGGQRASNNDNESISGPRTRLSAGLNNRRRRNVIESSPTSSPAKNIKSDGGHGNATVPARVPSSLDMMESSSSESDSDSSSSDDSEDDSQADSSDSSSDSSSSGDSSSNSESESEAEVATPSRTKGTGTSQSQKATAATSSFVKPGPTFAASQSSVQTPVVPGQGLTKTQRRNIRRRIQKSAQKASRSVESPQVPTAQDADLMAKKQALLRSLGVSPSVSKGGDKPAADPCTDTPLDAAKGLSKEKEDIDAWRPKISYRAVECVNEGVALSEPPFPFVQRWDSSQRRGKRKSRDDSQFYDGSNQSQKKRKCGQSSRQLADNYRDDTTMFSLNQDDVTLNYDDEPVARDEGRMEVNNTGNDHPTTVEGDLPALPADMSSLPQLSPDDLQPGLIIAYKELLLTKANNWQPQLSNFKTAVVDEVDPGGKFQVQLAKRDREVDKDEKEYDDEGGRIYAKFEVPDDDEEEDEEADLGYRYLSFSELIDPRTVRRPSPSTTETQATHPPEQDVEVADSQPSHKGGTNNKSSSNSDQWKTMDIEQYGQGDEVNVMDVDSTDGPITAGDSFVSETNHDVIADNETDVGAQLEALAQDVSISEERRCEISQLIHEGGFRQGVRSSIDQLTLLQFGSPSRQLQEEASSMLPSRQLQSSQRVSSEEASEEAPSEYGSKDPSQQEAHLPAVATALDDFHSARQSPSQLGVNSDSAHENGGAFGHSPSNRNVEYPKLDVSFTSQTSARSGRQIDPDFITHSDDLGHGLPDDSAIMNGFDDDDAALNDSNPADERGQADGAIHERTPTQEVYNDDLPHAQDAAAHLTPFKSTQIAPETNGRPTSAGSASTGSSSIFVDFELIGSQPAMSKFREHIKEETTASQNKVKGEQVSQATQGMTGLPDINETSSPSNSRSRSPENGRSQSVDGTPVSQRSRHLTRSVRQSPRNTNDEGSVSQRIRRSSRLMDSNSSPPVARTAETARKAKKHSTKGSPTPNGKPKSLIASFDVSVSPPLLSKLRQKPARAPSSSPGRGQSTTPAQKGGSFKIPAGSQVMSLLTSSPGPRVDESSAERKDGEDGVRFDLDHDDPFAEAVVERYAEDDIDGDYHDSAAGSVPSTINKLRARKSPSTRATRGASVPVAEVDGADDEAAGGWAPSTYQGPGGRKTSAGKVGGRGSGHRF